MIFTQDDAAAPTSVAKVAGMMIALFVLAWPGAARAEGKCSGPCREKIAIFISPTAAEIEAMKHAYGDDFEILADDQMYYEWQATELFAEHHFPYCFTELKKHRFPAADGREAEVDSECDGWCLVLWNGRDDPVVTDAIDLFMHFEYLGLPAVDAPAEEPSERTNVLVDGGQFDCLPVADFGLRGIRLWEPAATVPAALGEPASITFGSGEDDSGPYDVNTYHYADLEVDIVRGMVDRVITTSDGVVMPSGIRVGDTMDSVLRVLGRRPRGWQGEESQFVIVTCPVNGQWIQEDYVTLTFDPDRILTGIAYEAQRP